MTDPPVSAANDEKKTTSVPTLLKQGMRYKVYDPELLAGTKHDLDAAGVPNHTNAATQGLLGLLGIVASAVAAAVFLGSGPVWSYLLWGAAGAVAGLLVVVLVVMIVSPDPMRAYQKRNGGTDPFVDVGEGNVQAARLCQLAEDIASSNAWKQGRIDPDRLIPATLWSAVRLSLQIAEQSDRLAADQARGASETVLAPTREEITSGKSDVDHVETNLREIRKLAREVDARAAVPARATTTMTAGSLGAPSHQADLAVAGSDAILAQSQALRDLL